MGVYPHVQVKTGHMGLLVQPRPQAPTQTFGFRRKQWMAQERGRNCRKNVRI